MLSSLNKVLLLVIKPYKLDSFWILVALARNEHMNMHYLGKEELYQHKILFYVSDIIIMTSTL